jgi:hypothetical protein
MSKPAWHAYEENVKTFIPRLSSGQELEHRAKLLLMRDRANTKRAEVKWQADQILYTISSLVTAHALSTKPSPDEIGTLWDVVSKLWMAAGLLQTNGPE